MTRDGSMKNLFVWAGLAALLLALAFAWFFLPTDKWIQALGDWIKDYGVWGVLIFAIVYVIAVVIMAPASVFTIAAGLVYGVWAFPLIVVAATIGATLAFLVARHLIRKKVAGLIEAQPKLKAIDEIVAEDGWKIVGFVRLSPLVPFNLQNYFFGATDVALLPFVAATVVALMPGTALYIYLVVLWQ